MRNQKGITLIALVITIIVLLILAGVSIAMLTGDNGLLSKTQQSVKDNAIAAAKDEVSTEVQAIMADFLQEKYSSTDTNATSNAKYYGASAAQTYIVGDLNTTYATPNNSVRECTITITPATATTTATTDDAKITLKYDDRKVEGRIADDGTLSWGAIGDA